MRHPRRLFPVLLGGLATASLAQTDPPPAASSTPAAARTEPGGTQAADQPAVDAEAETTARPPLGWLSDPETPPADFFGALVSGKIHLDNRLRVELADSTGFDSSTAVTNRLRLGYETKPIHGFSGLVEMENVFTFDEDNYSVPATGDGTPTRTTVADPADTEVNRAWGRFDTDSLGDTGVSLDVKGGRQRIKLDDDRFVGNVGWRQFEQTFDAARIVSNLGTDVLTAQYAYVWHVQRIFSEGGPNWDSDSHLINVSAEIAPELTVTPFVYLLDFRGDSPADSGSTFGVRLTGKASPWENKDVWLGYEFTYAHQEDAGSNPVDYQADFFATDIRLARKGLGGVLAGYQFLGSDDGDFAFRFPLGTNHAFQGFADLFLTTPDTGLQDFYAGVFADLPWGVKGAFTFHQFWSDVGGTDLGSEYDFVASKALTPNWSVLAKAGFFDGHNGQPDVSRVWFQTAFSF